MIAALILLVCAIAGIIASTGFLVLIVFAALRFRRSARQQSAAPSHFPAVTVLKPVCGDEPELESSLTSFFNQDYPNFEIIFGARDEQDAAIQLARRIATRYPHIPVKFVFSGEPQWPNAKVWSMQKMCEHATGEVLVISDSDVRVTPDYLREVVRPFHAPEVGMVTCIYRGVPTGGFWTQLEALGMSVEMTAGVIAANLLEGMRFALGPTMAIRRNLLDSLGGMKILGSYCADDYVLGNETYLAGRTVVLSHHVIDHIVLNRAFTSSMLHQTRWMKSARFSRSWGHIGTVLTYAMPFGLLGLLGGLLSGRPIIGTALLAWAVLNRIVMSLVVGWGVARDWRAVKLCWLYPLRDLLGFCFWCASFVGTTIVWRNDTYRLMKRGKMVRIAGARDKTSEPVAVNHLS